MLAKKHKNYELDGDFKFGVDGRLPNSEPHELPMQKNNYMTNEEDDLYMCTTSWGEWKLMKLRQ